MRRIAFKLARDLALVPLTAFLTWQLVAHLPISRDTESKTAALVSVEKQLKEDLGLGSPAGFLRPWQKLAAGERIGTEALAYDARDFARALWGSLRLGAAALLLALLQGALFAFVRLRFARGATGTVLGALPALVYATPTFLLALLVAMLATTPRFHPDAWEPLGAWVMSVGPSAFVGVVLYDALRAELVKPYVQAARARGASARRLLLRHALPNALPALLDAVGPLATSLLAGSFVVERLFNITHFGFLYVYAAQQLELGVVVVATTLFASLLVLVSVAVELLRLWVDPRARAAAQEATPCRPASSCAWGSRCSACWPWAAPSTRCCRRSDRPAPSARTWSSRRTPSARAPWAACGAPSRSGWARAWPPAAWRWRWRWRPGCGGAPWTCWWRSPRTWSSRSRTSWCCWRWASR